MAQNQAISEQSSKNNKWRCVKVGARKMMNITYRELVGIFRHIFYISKESEGFNVHRTEHRDRFYSKTN